MDEYAIHLEFDRRDPTQHDLEQLLEHLGHLHAAVGTSPAGWVDAQVTVPGESMAQAVTIALQSAAAAGETVIRCETMIEREFARRLGVPEIPQLVGATEAAAMLGVSRQAVQQMHSAGRLPGQRVGSSLVFARAQVEAALAGRG